MNRRDFPRRSAASAAVLSAAGRIFISPSVAQTAAKVALVKTVDRAKGIRAAINLISFSSPKARKVVIKPNFNTADPTPGSTHNDTLRQLVLEMKARGAAKITVAERSGPPATKSVIDAKGIPALAEELGFDIINIEDLPPEGWAHFNPPGNHCRRKCINSNPGRQAGVTHRRPFRPRASDLEFFLTPRFLGVILFASSLRREFTDLDVPEAALVVVIGQHDMTGYLGSKSRKALELAFGQPGFDSLAA